MLDWSSKVIRASLDAYNEPGVRVIANKGGTRSGKTFSLVMVFVHIAHASESPLSIDVVSESLPHLKRGTMKDAEDVLEDMGLIEGDDYDLNRSDHVYTFPNGCKITFFSADDWGKVKGSRRDVLFINECNRVPYEVYRQLAVRTKYKIFLDWNPDSEFWYEQKGISTSEKTREIHSTYKDNAHLTREQVAEIESHKADENWWRVYGEGLTGYPQGQIYTNWDIVQGVPEGAVLVGRGLDFGFTNDPTAIIDVYKSGGELYLDEREYLHGMTNDRIASALRGLDGWTIADSAELKSITEIRNYGIKKIEPAEKGPDSVRAGIDILRRYRMHITARSANVIYEARNYRYKEDKINGEILNEPIDKFNHALDAVRYVALNRLNEKPRAARPRARKLATA